MMRPARELVPHPARSGVTRRAALLSALATGASIALAQPAAGGSPADSASSVPRFPANFRRRADWGADESLRFGPDGTELFPTAFFDVQTVTVHHTATPNGDPDPAARVRSIYVDHTVTQNFGDIGYHLLIDEAGTVYEGRFSGPDRIPVFGGKRAGLLPQMCNAAHVAGFNAANVGVALLADLTVQPPTVAARRSLVSTLVWLFAATRLDPVGTTSYVNPISGATRTVPTLAGHRDWAATQCPGNTFYPLLAGVRTDVAARLS